MKYIWRIDCIRSLFVSLQVWHRVHSTKNSTWCRASCERTKDVAQQRSSYCAFKMSSNVVCQAPFYRNPKKKEHRRVAKLNGVYILLINYLFLLRCFYVESGGYYSHWRGFIVYRTINTKHLRVIFYRLEHHYHAVSKMTIISRRHKAITL